MKIPLILLVLVLGTARLSAVPYLTNIYTQNGWFFGMSFAMNEVPDDIATFGWYFDGVAMGLATPWTAPVAGYLHSNIAYSGGIVAEPYTPWWLTTGQHEISGYFTVAGSEAQNQFLPTYYTVVHSDDPQPEQFPTDGQTVPESFGAQYLAAAMGALVFVRRAVRK